MIGCGTATYPSGAATMYAGMTAPLELGATIPPACDYEGGASLRPGETQAAYDYRAGICLEQLQTTMQRETEPGAWEQVALYGTQRLIDDVFGKREPAPRAAAAPAVPGWVWIAGAAGVVVVVLAMKRRKRRG